VGGAVVGAIIVSALPQILLHYADSLPIVASPGGSGLQPNDASRFLYGAAVVAVLILASGGLAGLTRRFRGSQPTPKEHRA
jgi:branched-chain amino acid transport system permease protein